MPDQLPHLVAQSGDPFPTDDFRVENRKAGIGVRQTADRPLTKINVWAPRTTVCPEGFLDIRADPGRDATWRITYQFYELPAGR